MEWSARTPMTGKGRVVIPCYLVFIASRQGSASVRPVRVQAKRLDAGRLGFFGAGPTCPSCPTKISKRGEQTSAHLPNLINGVQPPPKAAGKGFAHESGQVGLVGPRQR